ncbi:kinesin-like protein KIN-10B [Phoenix dactylifera]|uniref:Kinesin-like protein KIN-10B n=1 Tax=Phoenix dactylifera TaxID=42345 RepID=A0A8B8ZNF2_PHODC|nr:kinesin-like protein KIN-10B [Phoenix dactylifera]
MQETCVSPIATDAESKIPESPKDVSVPDEHNDIYESETGPDIGSTVDLEESIMKESHDSLVDMAESSSPLLSEQLRKISNDLKSLSTREIRIGTFDHTKPPQEIFRTHSIGDKKSLVEACLSFLNRANKEELKQLKWIGEKRATYILELREETPEPFKEIEDLKELGLSSKQINEMMPGILTTF